MIAQTSLDAALRSVRLYGKGIIQIGGDKEIGGAEWLLQASSTPVSIGSAGPNQARINFPKPFPVGLLVVVASSNAGQVNVVGGDLSGFLVFCTAAGTVTIGWMALGC